MRIFVTGGSGFLGSHTVAAMAAGGHEIVALVRDESKLRRALAPLLSPDANVAVVIGDVSDEASITRGLDGADAVLHAAAVYSLGPARRKEMHRTNVEGTRRVLTAAVKQKCDPIVHVSSITALWPLSKTDAVPNPAIGTARGPYTGTKRMSEAFARTLQGEGAPVVCTHPGNIFGPHDPGPGEMLRIARGFLGNRFPFLLSDAGFTVVDVRWLAKAHAALMVPGQGPRLVPMGGIYLSWNDFFALLRTVTGRRLPQVVPSPRWLTLVVGQLADVLRSTTGIDLPYSHEQNLAAYDSGRTDDSLAQFLAGLHPDPADTLRDAFGWLAAAGHLPKRLAGHAAPA